jgi:hypothetical protein
MSVLYAYNLFFSAAKVYKITGNCCRKMTEVEKWRGETGKKIFGINIIDAVEK